LSLRESIRGQGKTDWTKRSILFKYGIWPKIALANKKGLSLKHQEEALNLILSFKDLLIKPCWS